MIQKNLSSTLARYSEPHLHVGFRVLFLLLRLSWWGALPDLTGWFSWSVWFKSALLLRRCRLRMPYPAYCVRLSFCVSLCVCVCMHVACVCVCVLTSHEKVHNISCSGSSLGEVWKKLNSSQWEGSELGGELNRWRKWILYFVFHIFAFHISILYFVFEDFLFLKSWWIKQAAEVNPTSQSSPPIQLDPATTRSLLIFMPQKYSFN